jgi:hypothetical protein
MARLRHIGCIPPRADDPGRFTVLLSRCAWHPRYHGYPLVEGVASWSGWGVKFTDGICADCATRFRAEHRDFFDRRRGESADDVEVSQRIA